MFEGWKQVGPYKDTSELYVKEELSDSTEIIVPVTKDIADYPAIVAQLIDAFSRGTQKSELAVFRDLSHSDRDVIRVRAPHAEEDNSIAVDAGVQLVTEARNMLAAAACAAKERRSSFHVGKVQQANEYMSRVKLGQTEPGSFVVTLLAPVPPTFSDSEQKSFWPDYGSEPYDRQVTRILADGLEATANALANLNRGRGFSVFEEAVSSGVSANLLEAIASLAEWGRGADFRVTWARTRPAPTPQTSTQFTHRDAEPLREVARQFRLREPRIGVTLLGTTTNLHRSENQDGGRVTLATFIDNDSRSVIVDLQPEDYEVAVRAHWKRKPIVIEGDLYRDGQRWRLRSPRGLRVLNFEE
jgi:hypothetical protein